MKKFPFTNEGFQAQQTVLYVLPDAQLKLEATQIKKDFKNWMANHFELAQTQLNFLQELDKRALSLIAFETSFAVANRLAISLNKADPPADGDIDKIIWPKSTLSAKADKNFGYEASGTLEINIAYRQ